MIYCIRSNNYKVLTISASKSLSFKFEAVEKQQISIFSKRINFDSFRKRDYLINSNLKC